MILNGPCAVGKSTIAAKLHELIPLSFLLDVDAQMRFISHYREYPEERKKATIAISDVLINAMLELGHDVIVDKMIFHEEILDSYYSLAEKYNAKVYEIILWAPKEVILQRADDRGWRKDGLLTPEKLEIFWDKINQLKENRANAVIFDTSKMSEELVFQKVKKLVI